MFDIGWTEMLVIASVAILVVGPKDLPRLLRTVGKTIGNVRRMATDFQGQFNDALKEAEVAEIKNDVAKATKLADINSSAEEMMGDLKIGSELDDDENLVEDEIEAPALAPAPAFKAKPEKSAPKKTTTKKTTTKKAAAKKPAARTAAAKAKTPAKSKTAAARPIAPAAKTAAASKRADPKPTQKPAQKPVAAKLTASAANAKTATKPAAKPKTRTATKTKKTAGSVSS